MTWVRGLGLEQWGVIASLLIGTATLYFAWHASRVALRSLRASEAQLEIAKTQDEMQPDLRVDMRLVDQEESDAMEGSVDLRWISGLRELRKKGVSSLVSALVRQRGLHDAATEQKVVVVEVANHGTASTRLVKGWVYLEATRMEPVNPSGDPAVSLTDGVYSVAVLEKEETLTPRLSFSSRVIVAVRPGESRATEIGYAFAVTEGHGPKGSKEMCV